MNFAPIIIPTLNRYTHFKNCVESLTQCPEALETILIVSIDYPPTDKYVEGWKEITEYAKNITGFKSVKIISHTENLGAIANWRFCADYCQSRYETYIATEDDNVFSPCFLQYMNYYLVELKDRVDIQSITGYNPEMMYDQGGAAVYLSKDNSAWGIGYWTKKEQGHFSRDKELSCLKEILHSPIKGLCILRNYPALYLMLSEMINKNLYWEDTVRTTFNLLNNSYQLRPAISLVRNCGNDGTGVNCGINNLVEQNISNLRMFDFSKPIGNWNYAGNREALFNQCLPISEVEKNDLLRKIRKLYFKTSMPVIYRVIYGIVHLI